MPNTAGILRRYFFLLFLVLGFMIALFWHDTPIEGRGAWVYVVLTTVAYAGAYTLLALLPSALMARLSRKLPWRTPLIMGAAVTGGTLATLAVYADYRLFQLYHYHFNGFVWNLLTTQGGVAALGATASTQVTAVVHVLLILLANLAAIWGLHRYAQKLAWIPASRPGLAATFLIFLLAGCELTYAYSIRVGKEPVLAAADAIPFHLHSSASILFDWMGVKKSGLHTLRLAGGHVTYPLKPVDSSGLKKDMNVIVLVAESFRWDLLNPQITPRLWAFSQRASRYEDHYSGGNRTRMGLFSLFYGIYAPYWYSFEKEHVAPVLMNVMRDHGYQMAALTSQSFNYPELRHTVFSGVPESSLQELQQGEPWKRDTQNIDDLIQKVDQRDAKKPFFGFMFFESTHAPYSFPKEDVVRKDYVEDMNYVNLNLADNIEGIHARYINAAHHIDAQVGRLIDHLQETGMLDNTVLLFTGDHGEEFMEKGHWGHGHGETFPEEQVRVPLVLWRPGMAPEVITRRTSHLQVAPTILSYLGVNQDVRTYASAPPLDKDLPAFVLGEYDHMGIADAHYKISFPYTGRDYFHYTVFDGNDQPVPWEEKKKVLKQYAQQLDDVLGESRRFVQ